MKRKKNTQKKISKKAGFTTQFGAVELAVFVILALFAVLVTGALTMFNPSEVKQDNSSPWIYEVIPTQQQQQFSKTLNESQVYSITIPKRVWLVEPRPGSHERNLGNIPSVKYVSPSVFLKNHPTDASYVNSVVTFIGQNTNPANGIVRKAYADVPPDNANLFQYDLPYPGDQDGFGSCTSWSTVYNLYGVYANAFNYYPIPGGLDPVYDAKGYVIGGGSGSKLGGFAPMYAFSQQCQSKDCGTSFQGNFDIMQGQGVDRRDFYPQGDYSTKQVTDPERKMASNYKITQYNTLFSRGPFGKSSDGYNAETAIKQDLAHGVPVVMAFYATKSLFAVKFGHPEDLGYIMQDGPRTTDKQGNTGSHAVLAYAYDKLGVWFQNEWGSDWGRSGQAEVTWDFFLNQVIEAYDVNVPKTITIPTLPPSSVTPTDTPTPIPPSNTPSNTPVSPSANPCAGLVLNADCGLDQNNIGLFCGGNCGVVGDTNTLFQCQGTKYVQQTACSPQCQTCHGAPHADQCGTSACGPGASPGPGAQCKANGGGCGPMHLCSIECKNCNVNNDCAPGQGCCQ